MADGLDHDDSPTQVVELVVNLDDATGEQVGAYIQQLIDCGALDAWATPITMKKGRPAVALSALVPSDQYQDHAQAVLQITGSFGIRFRMFDRIVLDRVTYQRETRLGMVRLKAGSLAGKPVTVKPEFDDVRALAASAGVPLNEAYRAASGAADVLLAELKEGAGHG